LNIVELFSNNSPLLIIKNEKQNRKRELNELTLRGQFENIKETLATNLENNYGLDEILAKIKYYISNLDHIGNELPKTWVKVRQALENDQRNYISFDEYSKICETNGIIRVDDQLQLSGYLHDFGVCLHFQDKVDSILYRTVILKPEWGTDAVYKVLDNQKVINQKGYFTRNDLKIIWQDPKYFSMRGELLELMKKFQLCYEIPGIEDALIVPELLSNSKPKYDWNESNNLILRYTYHDFMPKGIINRFVVMVHQYIDQQKYVWKSGVILKQDNSKAEVIEDFGKREIRIRVVGNDRRSLLTIITNEIDKINNSYKRLKYQKLIPCNCKACQQSLNPYTYEFKKLVERLAYGKANIECGNPPSYSNVQVLSLIDHAIDVEQLIAQDKPDCNKSINFGGNIEQLIFQLAENGDFSGDLREIMRKINIGKGNYNERIEGDYCEQKGDNNTMSNVTQNHSGSGDNVAGDKNTTNNYNSQDLAQAAAEIQALLEQLEEAYPTNTTLGKVAIAEETIQRIDNNPQLSSRVLSALKAGGTSALDSFLDHPAASFVIGALEDWHETKQSS
ncbi:MAG: COR domain-containing protein, partial [Cyanobacteria bacterium P01_A01_bin.40]